MNTPTDAHRVTLNEFERKSSDSCHLNHEDQALFLQLIADSEARAVEVATRELTAERELSVMYARNVRACEKEINQLRAEIDAGNMARQELRERIGKLDAYYVNVVKERDELRVALLSARLDLKMCGAVDSSRRIEAALAKSAP